MASPYREDCTMPEPQAECAVNAQRFLHVAVAIPIDRDPFYMSGAELHAHAESVLPQNIRVIATASTPII